MDNHWKLGEDPRREPNFLQQFLFSITLRHSGNNLLTNDAKGYLIAMSVIMILVAAAEGMAWGYFGTTIMPSNSEISGILAGILVF